MDRRTLTVGAQNTFPKSELGRREKKREDPQKTIIESLPSGLQIASRLADANTRRSGVISEHGGTVGAGSTPAQGK